MKERIFSLTGEEASRHPPRYPFHSHNYLCRLAENFVPTQTADCSLCGIKQVTKSANRGDYQ
ncbi:MAG: hypothetical protein MJ078_02155 [Clostridia bacterium]|nr:hypothetical protein [Clostridia bacterium]